ncbi:hypothetical protein MY3296_001314 [Beauveria thailandica]
MKLEEVVALVVYELGLGNQTILHGYFPINK